MLTGGFRARIGRPLTSRRKGNPHVRKYPARVKRLCVSRANRHFTQGCFGV
jgi:hypothetical protein